MKRKNVTRDQLKPFLRSKPLWVVWFYSKPLLLLLLPLVVFTPFFTRDTLVDVLSEWWEIFASRFVENDNKEVTGARNERPVER